MYQIGLSTMGKLLDDAYFSGLKNSGLSAIELSYSMYDDFDYNNAKYLSDKYNIALWSLHLPFAPFDILDPSSLEPEKQERTFNIFLEIIKRASDIGIDKVIVHPSVEPISDEEREDRLDSAGQFLSGLSDEAYKYGVTVAIENLPRTCLGRNSEEINYLLSFNKNLRACFDTNHLLSEKASDFIKNVGNKIITLHVSDYDFVNERHWLPGEGDINWSELYNNLNNISYNGIWLYEVSLNKPLTIVRRELKLDDFYNNANEIFYGQKVTAIGKRIENLGFWGPK